MSAWHDPVHVSILAKHINGKVFIINTTYSGKGPIPLNNQLEIDLLLLKENLDQYFTEWTKIGTRGYGLCKVGSIVLDLIEVLSFIMRTEMFLINTYPFWFGNVNINYYLELPIINIVVNT